MPIHLGERVLPLQLDLCKVFIVIDLQQHECFLSSAVQSVCLYEVPLRRPIYFNFNMSVEGYRFCAKCSLLPGFRMCEPCLTLSTPGASTTLEVAVR
eukprot:3297524-Amphidinium_carterae.1